MFIKQRNLIMAVLAIVLIVGGIYYSKQRNLSNSLLVEYPEGEVDKDFSSIPPQSGIPQEGNTGQSATSTSASTELTLKQKFDLVMKNASKASLKGDYVLALKYYNDALLLKKSDVVYSGMFNVYSAQQNWVKAEETINNALEINPKYTEYWKWKLTLLDERTSATFTDLKKIYEEALIKSDRRTKINLITHFATIAEYSGEKGEAISLWEYAKEINSIKSAIYQAEIDRLKL